MNSMLTIYPYKQNGIWKFDDKNVGVHAEPFVGDINTMIDIMVEREGIKSPERGFTALFSHRPFPGVSMVMRKVDPPKYSLDDFDPEDIVQGVADQSFGGAYYQAFGLTGWLCPVLSRYFPAPPPLIYVRAENRPNTPSIWTRLKEWLTDTEELLPAHALQPGLSWGLTG